METFYFVSNGKKIFLHIEKELLASGIDFELRELLSEQSAKPIKEIDNIVDNTNHILWISNTSEQMILNYLKKEDINDSSVKVYVFNKLNRSFNKLSYKIININEFFVSELKHRRKMILNKDLTLNIINKKNFLPTKIKKIINNIFPPSNNISKTELFLNLSPELNYSKFGQINLKEKISLHEEIKIILNGIKIINSNYFDDFDNQFEKVKDENKKIRKSFLKKLFKTKKEYDSKN